MIKPKLPFANKNLGQHFLNDQKVISRICNDHKESCGSILEIGPGPGILTQHLALHNKPFHVIEMDQRMPEFLEQFIQPDQIHIEDALKTDLDQFLKTNRLVPPVWLVSNLPYNVGVPLLINFLQAPTIEYMTLMFQKEVGEKIVSLDPRDKNSMNSLMALTNNYFECSVVCKVPPGAFIPPPKVDSIVLSFRRIKAPVIPLEQFSRYEKFLRQLFSMKRKQIGKVLKSYYNPTQVEAALSMTQIPTTQRAEALTIDQVRALFNNISGQ